MPDLRECPFCNQRTLILDESTEKLYRCVNKDCAKKIARVLIEYESKVSEEFEKQTAQSLKKNPTLWAVIKTKIRKYIR